MKKLVLMLCAVLCVAGLASAEKVYTASTANDGTDVWVAFNEVSEIVPDSTTTFVRTKTLRIYNPDAEVTITTRTNEGVTADHVLLAGQPGKFEGELYGFLIDKTTTQVVSWYVTWD